MVQQQQAKAAAIIAVANAESKISSGASLISNGLGNTMARPGYAPVPASAIPSVRKVGPPVVENRIGMGGLQSPVQVGGAGFNADITTNKKSSSSRRRANNKNKSSKGGGGAVDQGRGPKAQGCGRGGRSAELEDDSARLSWRAEK